jgi:hypothetical protein
MQSALNYYASTKGAFLHVEVEKLDATLTNDLGIVSYLIEDSLIGDQKMSDNSHNSSYIHRDIHRGNLNAMPFGRTLTDQDLSNGKYFYCSKSIRWQLQCVQYACFDLCLRQSKQRSLSGYKTKNHPIKKRARMPFQNKSNTV